MLFLVKVNWNSQAVTIGKGQSNFSIAFIFVSCEEKDFHHVVSVGQFGFDCYSTTTRSAGAVASCKAGCVVNSH